MVLWAGDEGATAAAIDLDDITFHIGPVVIVFLILHLFLPFFDYVRVALGACSQA